MAGADQHWNPEGRDPLDEGHLALPLVGSWIPVRVVEKGFTKSTYTGLRPQREPGGRNCDGQGLYLDVRPTGSRDWIQRLTIRGRRTELGLGGFPLVSLKEAREKAFANRKLARDGGNPRAEKRRAESMPNFADATRAVWKQLRPGWRSP